MIHIKRLLLGSVVLFAIIAVGGAISIFIANYIGEKQFAEGAVILIMGAITALFAYAVGLELMKD